jgi:RimJ/RimL family protein N-acetyltransferase
LFAAAKEMGLVDSKRKFNQANKGIYPFKYEETIIIKNIPITFRPAKPVDERFIQEHYYTMNRGDIVSRFFHEKRNFAYDQIETTYDIDYINDQTIVATIGELGFEKVIAVGEYFRNTNTNMAEVAYSVSKEYQGMGIATILQKKINQAAIDNGIKGLTAYISSHNKSMISLFHKQPYKITTERNEDVLILTCMFNEPKEDDGGKALGDAILSMG